MWDYILIFRFNHQQEKHLEPGLLIAEEHLEPGLIITEKHLVSGLLIPEEHLDQAY